MRRSAEGEERAGLGSPRGDADRFAVLHGRPELPLLPRAQRRAPPLAAQVERDHGRDGDDDGEEGVHQGRGDVQWRDPAPADGLELVAHHLEDDVQHAVHQEGDPHLALVGTGRPELETLRGRTTRPDDAEGRPPRASSLDWAAPASARRASSGCRPTERCASRSLCRSQASVSRRVIGRVHRRVQRCRCRAPVHQPPLTVSLLRNRAVGRQKRGAGQSCHVMGDAG